MLSRLLELCVIESMAVLYTLWVMNLYDWSSRGAVCHLC